MEKYVKYFVQIVAFFVPAFLKVALWRCLGFKIGKRVKIGLFSFVMVEQLHLGDDACLDPFTLVALLKELYLGDKSRIAVFSKVYGGGSFKAERRNLVSVQCLIECHPGCAVIMRDYACFGPRNTIYTHGDYLPPLQGYPSKRGDVIIGEYSWTGMATVLLPGTTIGARTIITPGAVLSGQVPGNSFIKSSAYQYDVVPLEGKMTQRSSRDILRYMNNALALSCGGGGAITAAALKRVQAEPGFLFQDLSLAPPGIYKGKALGVYDGHAPSKTAGDMIVAGYGLPEEIKKAEGTSWMDFKDYAAGPESDKVLSSLIERLYLKLNLRFLFVKHGTAENPGGNGHKLHS